MIVCQCFAGAHPNYCATKRQRGECRHAELAIGHEPSKLLLQRRANAPLRPAKEQQPCDVGLFSEDASQLDLCEVLRNPKP